MPLDKELEVEDVGMERDERIQIELGDKETRVMFVNEEEEEEEETGNGDTKAQQNNPLLLSRLNTEVNIDERNTDTQQKSSTR